LSKNKCIFGGYTPLAWSSQASHVSDPSLKSFVFTIKNPHSLPPQIFKLKQEAKAIYNHQTLGPTFGSGFDLNVYSQSQSSTNHYSSLGNAYANDTGIGGQQVLTGDRYFFLDELEVFEVI
jgi:hypothetical protein